ncbi:hypothetical protein OSTOST_06632, partial [Ostertagia ostertagi]
MERGSKMTLNSQVQNYWRTGGETRANTQQCYKSKPTTPSAVSGGRFEHSVHQSIAHPRSTQRESTFGSPTRIAQVFPLIPKDHAVPYIQRSVQDVSTQNNNGPHRAHSVELLQPDVSEEIRRASFDVPRGTGRQLPSTEGLE